MSLVWIYVWDCRIYKALHTNTNSRNNIIVLYKLCVSKQGLSESIITFKTAKCRTGFGDVLFKKTLFGHVPACTSECQICKSPIIHNYLLRIDLKCSKVLFSCAAKATKDGVISGEVLTSIVVTVSVLLANVSDVLMSKDVEFIANVLLEYQTPICTCKKKNVEDASLLYFNYKD